MQARAASCLSSEHFTADGTMIKAGASHKSFKRRIESRSPLQRNNPDPELRREQRSNETHQSATDPKGRLYRKSNAAPAPPRYMGCAPMEYRDGISVHGCTIEANGKAESNDAIRLLEAGPKKCRITFDQDKNYATRELVDTPRSVEATHHFAQSTNYRISAIDKSTTRHPGYAVSVFQCNCIEEIFGLPKTEGPDAQKQLTGQRQSRLEVCVRTLAAYDPVRMIKRLPTRGLH